MITAYFDDKADKIAFLATLAARGRRDEALILCCVYLDGLGAWLAKHDGQPSEAFCRALIDHGGNSSMGVVLPRRLLLAVPWKSAPKGVQAAVEGLLAGLDEHEAKSPEDMAALLAQLPVTATAWIQKHVWRGTVAQLVHERLRTPNIHSLGSPGGITFSATRVNGSTLPDIDFATLLSCLQNVFTYAKNLSISTDTWFEAV